MNLSKTGERTVFFYRSVLHPVVCISVPFLFNLCLLLIIPFCLQTGPVTPPFFPVLLFIVSLAAVILGNILYSVRVASVARIRELTVVLLVTYLYASIFLTGPIPERFRFHPVVLIPLAFSGLQWYLTVELQKRLRGREDFTALVERKTGTELQNTLRDYQPFAAEVVHDLQGLQVFLNGMLFILSLGVTICYFGGNAIPAGILLSYIVFSVLFFLLRAMLSAFTDEFGYYGEGIVPSRDDFRRRFSAAGIMLAACFVLSVALSSNVSLLPLSLIEDFLNFLMNLFSGPKGEVQPYIDRDRGPDPILELLKANRNRAPEIPDWLPAAFNILKYAALISLALFLLYRFVKPFFSAEFRSYLGRMHPFRVLLERMELFFAWLRSLFERRGDRKKLLAYGRHANPDYAETSSMRISEEKRRETNRIIRAFLKILAWGRRQGTSYVLGQTPGDYTASLLGTFPHLRKDFERIVQIFEEALFSSHLLGNRVTDEYYDLVRTVLRTRKVKSGVPEDRREEPEQ